MTRIEYNVENTRHFCRGITFADSWQSVLVLCVVKFAVNDVKTASRCSDTVTDYNVIVITTVISVIAADYLLIVVTVV